MISFFSYLSPRLRIWYLGWSLSSEFLFWYFVIPKFVWPERPATIWCGDIRSNYYPAMLGCEPISNQSQILRDEECEERRNAPPTSQHDSVEVLSSKHRLWVEWRYLISAGPVGFTLVIFKSSLIVFSILDEVRNETCCSTQSQWDVH